MNSPTDDYAFRRFVNRITSYDTLFEFQVDSSQISRDTDFVRVVSMGLKCSTRPVEEILGKLRSIGRATLVIAGDCLPTFEVISGIFQELGWSSLTIKVYFSNQILTFSA